MLNIRNFCIIAHIDHGKTTLSDRLLEITNSLSKNCIYKQFLDKMDLEREKGISIKSHPVTMKYISKSKKIYSLNLIDTPGHVDFSSEVLRSLKACEGALLLIDASQGIQSQTIATALEAIKQKLKIIPVINKIELENANIPKIIKQVENILSISRDELIFVSGKANIGIKNLLENIIKYIPQPINNNENTNKRALIFDSLFHTFKGIICYIRIFSGTFAKNNQVLFMTKRIKAEIKEVGKFFPEMSACQQLSEGEVGYLLVNIKDFNNIIIGDTITSFSNPSIDPIMGYTPINSTVFSGLYPAKHIDYQKLLMALEKLKLNDSSLIYKKESSSFLGLGFRCGFLGFLHMEIIKERLKREYNIEVIYTSPNVLYHVYIKQNHDKKTFLEIDNPVKFPNINIIQKIEEPIVKTEIKIFLEHLGEIMKLIKNYRGNYLNIEYLNNNYLIVHCEMPLNEIIVDFNNEIKSLTCGYGSLDYSDQFYKESNLIKMDILINGIMIDAFASIIHKSDAFIKGRILCKKIKTFLSAQLFKVSIQATVGNKIIIRETINPLRKDVTAKCYGGDITRKRKLLEKQKKGKTKMNQRGKINISKEILQQILGSN